MHNGFYTYAAPIRRNLAHALGRLIQPKPVATTVSRSQHPKRAKTIDHTHTHTHSNKHTAPPGPH